METTKKLDKSPLLVVNVILEPERMRFEVNTSSILEKMFENKEHYEAFRESIKCGLENFEEMQNAKIKDKE